MLLNVLNSNSLILRENRLVETSLERLFFTQMRKGEASFRSTNLTDIAKQEKCRYSEKAAQRENQVSGRDRERAFYREVTAMWWLHWETLAVPSESCLVIRIKRKFPIKSVNALDGTQIGNFHNVSLICFSFSLLAENLLLFLKRMDVKQHWDMARLYFHKCPDH